MFLKKILRKIKEFKLTRAHLTIANVFFVLFLILFSNLGILPFGDLKIALIAFLIFFGLFLYRPKWGFSIFCSSIVLETINLFSGIAGADVRPYQFFGVALILAVATGYLLKRPGIDLPKPNWFDGMALIFFLGGFLSVAGSYDKSLAFKQAVIMASFAVPYVLARLFVSSWDDLKKLVPVFSSSSAVVVLYGIFQNAMFQMGLAHFEVMPGRPNSTFSEPDWLGAFLVFVLAMFLSALIEIKKKKDAFFVSTSWISLITIFVLLTITVARSAWLGAFVVVMAFLAFSLLGFNLKKLSFEWKEFFGHALFVVGAVVASFFVTSVSNLTNFELQNRAVSTTSGFQEITIACQDGNVAVPNVIDNVNELKKFDCRHINLEEIETLTQEGKFVKKIKRTDPNIDIRSEIYEKSFREIAMHPFSGIGWGNIFEILGYDERGAGLNSSNIFLEVWLGAGILGIISFLAITGGMLWRGIFFLKKGNLVLGMIFVLGIGAILVPNMFNAGIMLGFVWLFFGLSGIKNEL